jgi:hypothetical protein
MMGVSSITLCRSLLSSLCWYADTLCSSALFAVIFFSKLDPSSLISHLPVGVLTTFAVSVEISFVSAHKCFIGVKLGTWQC